MEVGKDYDAEDIETDEDIVKKRHRNDKMT